MTLWPIADQETAQIMREFYAAAQTTGNAPLALSEVQRQWLINLRRDRGISAAVNLAGAFILTSQGRPSTE